MRCKLALLLFAALNAAPWTPAQSAPATVKLPNFVGHTMDSALYSGLPLQFTVVSGPNHDFYVWIPGGGPGDCLPQHHRGLITKMSPVKDTVVPVNSTVQLWTRLVIRTDPSDGGVPCLCTKGGGCKPD